MWCVCRFHKVKRKQKEKELRKELERAGGTVEQAEPLLYQRAMVGAEGTYVFCLCTFITTHLSTTYTGIL